MLHVLHLCSNYTLCCHTVYKLQSAQPTLLRHGDKSWHPLKYPLAYDKLTAVFFYYDSYLRGSTA